MTEQKLIPCPFCGGEVEMSHIGNEHTKTRKIEIACKTFGCTVKYTMGAAYGGFDWLEEKITKKWNTRADNAQRYKEALEFYAKKKNYEGAPYKSAIDVDKGSVAKNALKNNPQSLKQDK